jgi:hypothetical protein
MKYIARVSPHSHRTAPLSIYTHFMMVSLSIAASIDFESSAVPPKIEVFSKPEGDDSESDVDADADADANFGGAEARRILERKLLAKLDLRMVDLDCHLHPELCKFSFGFTPTGSIVCRESTLDVTDRQKQCFVSGHHILSPCQEGAIGTYCVHPKSELHVLKAWKRTFTWSDNNSQHCFPSYTSAMSSCKSLSYVSSFLSWHTHIPMEASPTLTFLFPHLRNMFMNWVGRPSIYLPTTMIVWGVISILTGPVTIISTITLMLLTTLKRHRCHKGVNHSNIPCIIYMF